MTNDHEVIVVGCGGLGSAALYWLSREIRSSVLGIEQFELGHERGASQDHSRIIRLAQHQSQYAALDPDAYESWYEVEHEPGHQLTPVRAVRPDGEGVEVLTQEQVNV